MNFLTQGFARTDSLWLFLRTLRRGLLVFSGGRMFDPDLDLILLLLVVVMVVFTFPGGPGTPLRMPVDLRR